MIEVFLAVLLIGQTTAGQLFLKKSSHIRENKKRSMFYLIIGYSLFTLTIVFSYIFLKLVPMKYFTVIMSLNYIAVMLGAYVFLNEKLEKENIIGTITVTIGVMVFLYGK